MVWYMHKSSSNRHEYLEIEELKHGGWLPSFKMQEIISSKGDYDYWSLAVLGLIQRPIYHVPDGLQMSAECPADDNSQVLVIVKTDNAYIKIDSGSCDPGLTKFMLTN